MSKKKPISSQIFQFFLQAGQFWASRTTYRNPLSMIRTPQVVFCSQWFIPVQFRNIQSTFKKEWRAHLYQNVMVTALAACMVLSLIYVFYSSVCLKNYFFIWEFDWMRCNMRLLMSRLAALLRWNMFSFQVWRAVAVALLVSLKQCFDGGEGHHKRIVKQLQVLTVVQYLSLDTLRKPVKGSRVENMARAEFCLFGHVSGICKIRQGPVSMLNCFLLGDMRMHCDTSVASSAVLTTYFLLPLKKLCVTERMCSKFRIINASSVMFYFAIFAESQVFS